MALLLGPKGPTVAAEGCSSPQELEKGARRAAIFLVIIIIIVDKWKFKPILNMIILIKDNCMV